MRTRRRGGGPKIHTYVTENIDHEKSCRERRLSIIVRTAANLADVLRRQERKRGDMSDLRILERRFDAAHGIYIYRRYIAALY